MCLIIPLFSILHYLLLLSPYDSSHGTAVFLIRTPNEIVVAADSRSVNENDIPDPEPVCKIRKFGNGYVVVNGMSQDSSGYDIFSVLKVTSKHKGLLADKVSAFESIVKAPLEKALNRIRHENPAAFQRNTIDIGSALGANFFGLENGELVLYDLRFVPRLSTDDEISVIVEHHSCPGTDCPSGVAVGMVGGKEFKESFIEENTDLKRGNLVEAARKFVQMQIDAGVVDVGAPIDILRITKDETKWIQRKSNCQDER